ncbi:MAG: putative MerR family transcriptional regulator [Acidimicrobiales bacterium]|nr:putative MerR family transcriptional regulator [Acidimicrobiales bacterium]
MPQVPIACSLTEEGLVDRVDEWRQFLSTSVTTVDASDTSARLLLRGDDDVLLRAVDLAEREKACCAFFEFGLALDSDGRWLTVAVPDDAAPILRDLLSLANG